MKNQVQFKFKSRLWAMDRYRKLSHRLFKIPWIIGYYPRRKQMTIKKKMCKFLITLLFQKLLEKLAYLRLSFLFSTSDMAYVTLNSKRVTFNATLDSLSPSKAAFNAQEDIRFLKSNDLVRTLVIILNHPIVFNSILVINAIFTVLLLVNIAKKRDVFRRNSPQKSRRKNYSTYSKFI